MKKILKSKYHDQKYIIINDEKFEVKSLPLNECWPSVPRADIHRNVPFYQPVKESIQKEGMHFPIMVYHATRWEIIEQKKIWQKHIEPLPFDKTDITNHHKKIYVIWGGSNRWHVAKELGYTHIDCALMPSFDKAYGLQKNFRMPYPNLYGGDPR